MAKTGLMGFLQRLVAEHDQAARAGLPVEAVRERALSRRGFLTGAAAVAVAGAAAGCVSEDRRSLGSGSARLATSSRIAIVGGGLAGLSAALTLADAGQGSTIYEALPNRTGGRMLSERAAQPGCGSCHGVSRPVSATWLDGQVTDVFGEMIDSGHTTMRSLATRYGLPLIDSVAAEPVGSTGTFRFAGAYYSKAQADLDYQKVVPALKADLRAAGYPTTYASSKPGGRALDAMSIYQWIESRVPGGHSSPFGKLLDIAYNIEFGAETSEQSALSLLYLLGYNKSQSFSEFGPSDERYRIAGGVDRLPSAMTTDLVARGVRIELGWSLDSIALRSDGSYALDFGGSQVIADRVILALPFAVLRGLDIAGAGFDALKLRAIREQGAGKNGKLQLQFQTRLWNQPGPWGLGNGLSYADTGYQNTWETTRGMAGRPILVNYVGGLATDALRLRHGYGNASDSSVLADADSFLTRVEPVFPGLRAQWTGRVAESIPHLAPVFRCSYSFWKPGQYQSIVGYERVRQGNVFFAGEHTSVDFNGWMEGAASEGVRAGKEILADLKGRRAELSRRALWQAHA